MGVGHIPQAMKQAAVGLPPSRNFTSEEIEDATNNFDPSNLIEEGSQGQVKDFFFYDVYGLFITSAL